MLTRTCSLDSQRAFMRDRPFITKHDLSKLRKGRIRAYIQRVIAGVIIHAILFFRLTAELHKESRLRAFTTLGECMSRAYGTLLVRAIKKRSAA